jgi:hypothetical protein
MIDQDCRKYYNLEEYLFTEVAGKFKLNSTLSVEDFFCIIIWRAERSKSICAARLKKGRKSLLDAVNSLMDAIVKANSAKEKLRVLLSDEWGFSLPTASAILTVLYQNEFTVYDFRVCDALEQNKKGARGRFKSLGSRANFERPWDEYTDYLKSVKAVVPDNFSLRDKDRWLWGYSFATQLENDAKKEFPKPLKKSKPSTGEEAGRDK